MFSLKLHTNVYILYVSKAQSRKDVWFFPGAPQWPVDLLLKEVTVSQYLKSVLLLPTCSTKTKESHMWLFIASILHKMSSLLAFGQETNCKCSRRRKTAPEYLKCRGHRFGRVQSPGFHARRKRAECPWCCQILPSYPRSCSLVPKWGSLSMYIVEVMRMGYTEQRESKVIPCNINIWSHVLARHSIQSVLGLVLTIFLTSIIKPSTSWRKPAVSSGPDGLPPPEG